MEDNVHGDAHSDRLPRVPSLGPVWTSRLPMEDNVHGGARLVGYPYTLQISTMHIIKQHLGGGGSHRPTPSREGPQGLGRIEPELTEILRIPINSAIQFYEPKRAEDKVIGARDL